MDPYLRNEAPTAASPGKAGEIFARPGTLIGPYRLVSILGRGGMGVVFRAEQQYPVKRAVALKLIKPGMDSEQMILRFEAERQALALMDHPSIAKVFDAGTSADGRLYFAMELVEGDPITTYSERVGLGMRERLDLFVLLCQAVQHAHEKGIIHRDIKPSNVLVSVLDGKPFPKVIDFGVAKAAGRGTQELIGDGLTAAGSMVGTLEYTSPEQSGLRNAVDERADIYSLGIVLYEMLTGTTPLQRERLRSQPEHEAMRLVREEEAPLPSKRIPDARVARMLRGELDWIVMRSLEKDPRRRYQSAGELAGDLRRHLNGEVVAASPPSATYRIGKLVRRHSVKLLAALVAAAGFAAAVFSLATRERGRRLNGAFLAIDVGEKL